LRASSELILGDGVAKSQKKVMHAQAHGNQTNNKQTTRFNYLIFVSCDKLAMQMKAASSGDCGA